MAEVLITNSLIQCFKGCQQKTKYKYVDLLVPKVPRGMKPLKRGSWFHELLEAKYGGESVTAAHKRNVAQFNRLLPEEREDLGDLPNEMVALYKAYQWHYRRDDSWKVHEVELKLEADLPNGYQGQGKMDALVEDENGDLWAVDHKTHERLPDWSYRMLDPQSLFYIWLCWQNNIPVRGFIWNYVVPKPPQPLKFKIKGGLYAKQSPVLDYPTALASVPEEEKDNPEVIELLQQLEQVRYDPNEPQTSPVFRREVIEKDPHTVERMVQDISASAARFERFVLALEEDPNIVVERTVGRNCDWCEYRQLCIAELMDTNPDYVRRKHFQKGDPMAYYQPTPKG